MKTKHLKRKIRSSVLRIKKWHELDSVPAAVKQELLQAATHLRKAYDLLVKASSKPQG